jgi:hypothetical protein
VQLDSIGDRQSMPAKRDVVVVGDSLIRARRKRWRQRLGNLSLERVTRQISQLGLDRVQTLSFPLSDLDRQ